MMAAGGPSRTPLPQRPDPAACIGFREALEASISRYGPTPFGGVATPFRQRTKSLQCRGKSLDSQNRKFTHALKKCIPIPSNCPIARTRRLLRPPQWLLSIDGRFVVQ